MAARQAIFTCRSRSSLIRSFSAITTTCTAKCRSVSRRRRSAERSKSRRRSEERRVGKECRSRCDWSSDVCSSDLVKSHPVFQRDHDDLHCEMPVSFATAALGGEIEIPTLDGSAKIRIPSETQSGKVFRLRGKGIRGVRSREHGDLLCHVVVETPVNL